MKFVSMQDNLADPCSQIDIEQIFDDERWHILGDMIPDGLILVDQRGIVRYMNSAAESINEVARHTIIGRTLGDLVKQARLDCAILLEAFARGGRINKVVADAAGRSYAISSRGCRKRSGDMNCFLVVIRNLDALAKIANYAGTAEGSGLAFIPAPGTPLSDADPVIVGEATSAVVTRGLRAIAMGSRLLVLGESGVGKTELARLLHKRSGASERPFVHVNCGSIPDSLFESEMFGYERGSFTGASTRGKKGLIEAADGGTLFLDEVGEIPLHCQAKILQMLEEGVIQRVGSTAPRRLRLQIVAATNRDLRALVAEGSFRRDLYYRLSVVTVHLPPLRERTELIPPLLERFLGEVNRRRPTPLKIDAACRRRLEVYGYPGNIRELQNIVEHLAVVCDYVATEADLPLDDIACSIDRPLVTVALFGETEPEFPSGFDLREAVRKYESHLIQAAIRRTGSKRKAADLLCVDIATVVRKSKGPSDGA